MSSDEIRWGPWIDDLSNILETFDKSILTLESKRSDIKAIENIKVILHSVKGLLDSVGLKLSAQTMTEIEEIIYHAKSVNDDLFAQLQKSYSKLEELTNFIETNKPKVTEIDEIDKSIGFESLLVKFGNEYKIDITIKAEKSSKASRALGAINIIKRLGRIKSSNPSEEDLYLDTKFDNLEIVLSSRENKDNIMSDIKKIPHVEEVAIEKIVSEDAAEGGINLDTLTLKIPLSQIRQLETGLATLSSHIEVLKSEVTTTRGLEEMTGVDNTFERVKNDIRKMRKVPFDSIAAPLTAMVSRLSQQQGKQIDFIIQGRFVTLDRAIASYLVDPITQIIRNAVIHGIEKIPARRKAKKNVVGRIVLNAVNDRDKIRINITDDGIGLNTDNIVEQAKKLNVKISKKITHQQKLDLIFDKGVSLSKSDKKIAGRGLGLYTAKDRLNQFGGNITVTSETDKGTSFVIQFTDQDALSKNLIVSVSNEIYALQSSEVEKVIIINSNDINYETDIMASCDYENEKLPVAILKNLINSEAEKITSNDQNIIVVTRGKNSLIGILVDSLMDERLVTIKPLNSILQKYELFNGTLIGRNKEVILVVNPAAII